MENFLKNVDAAFKLYNLFLTDQPSNLRHHFTREDNKDTSQLNRRGRLLSLKSDNDGDDDNEDAQGEIDSSSGRRRKKSWRDGESSARDEFLRLVSFTSSSSYRQQGKSSSSSSSGRPTAITATTITDAVPATSKQGAGKFFAARKQSSATGSSDGDPASGSLLLADDSTSSFLSSSPSSPSSSSSSALLSSKLKSIKYTSSFSSSSSNNEEHHLIPSSSTATLHYLNENSSADKVEGDSDSSIIRKISSSTLSIHNHRFRQQPQAEQEDERHYNEVFRFGDPPADEYEDEVIVDDNDVMEVENEDTSEVGRREGISNDDSNKIPMQSTTSTKTTKNNDNLLVSSSRESTNYLKQRTPNKSKLTNNRQQQSHHHQVSPTIFGGPNSSPADDGIVAELITNSKNNDGRGDKHMVLVPTATATAFKSVSSKRYPHSSQNGITISNNNNKPVVVDDMVEEVDQLMLGDDPSIIISRDNLFGGTSRISSSTSSNPLNKNTNASLSASYSASTTASTFGSGGGKQRNPLQIRRDLSRLVASGTGRGLNGGGNGGGSSLVGDDEEPMPNSKCLQIFMYTLLL